MENSVYFLYCTSHTRKKNGADKQHVTTNLLIYFLFFMIAVPCNN